MSELIYAVKSANNQEINKIFTNWEECKPYVLGKNAVYKSCDSREDAVAFLKSAPVKIENYGHGYIPKQTGKHTMFGKFKFVRCKEKTNGFCAHIYETLKGERFCCVGIKLPTNPRLLYAFRGEFAKNDKYGYEFMVETWSEHISENKNDIITYLSSGVIKGIGQKKAELIYKEFGSMSIDVIEKEPQKLLKIKGISKKILDKIIESYNENKASREIISFLLKYGISQTYGVHVYNQYGSNAVEKVKENPYIICRIRGLTYEDADRIAKDISYPLDSYERFEACAYYVIKKNEQSGDTGMETISFMQQVYSLLACESVTKEIVFKRTCDLVKNKMFETYKLKNAKGEIKQYLFTRKMVLLEKDIAKNVIRLSKNKTILPSISEIQREIKKAEEHFGFSLDEVQRNAVIDAFSNPFFVITGGPGTGKTTILCFINYIYRALYPTNRRIFLAPTGRAARIITETTGENAVTANSFLHFYDGIVDAEEEVLIDNALILTDEFSMVDVFLANALFSAIQTNCITGIIGDIDQLPSVGPGAVLRDIIQSGVVKIIRLEKIYRQDEDSQIYINCQKINNGDIEIEKETSDFHFHETSSLEDIKHLMGELYVKRTKEFGLGNVLCLCPVKDHIAGLYDMNEYLQKLLNPKKDGEKEVTHKKQTFRIGDLVMHIKTNTKEVANGDIGRIIEITDYYDKDGLLIEDDYQIYVDINNQTIVYSKENIDNLTLAYACTVHKSQGSQAPAIITCLTNYHRSMLYRNIPYVAVSRGKKQVDAFGEISAWEKAILNEDIEKIYRVTLTSLFLQYENGQFVRTA